MSINSVNLQNQNRYSNYRRNLNYNYQPSDNLSTPAASNPILNQDTFEYSSDNTSTTQRIASLKLQYQTAKDEQGIIGDCADWFKNLFNTKNCSNNIEIAINSLNENSTEEEIQAVEDMLGKYNSNQDSVVKGVASTGAMMTGGAVGAKLGATIGTAICPGLGTIGGFLCGFVVGAISGALTSIGINQIENMTDSVKDNSWQNDKNLFKEAGEGALSGGSAVLMGGITQKVTGAVASKVGLSSVKYGGKTALVTLAEDGVTAKVGATVAKNAFASAVGSGTAAATISGGSYALECAVDKDKDFSLTDFGTTAATSFAFGGLIGGATGGIQGYKGANGYNTSVHKAQIQAEAQARIKAETEAKFRAQQAQEQYNKPFEEKLSNKSAEESAKVFEMQSIDANVSNQVQFEADKDFCEKIINKYTKSDFTLPSGTKLKIKDRITDPDELMQALEAMKTPYDTQEIVEQRAKSLVAGRLNISNCHTSSLKKDSAISGILADATESIRTSTKGREIYVIAGNTASGKSTYCANNGLNAKNGYFVIDSDDIKTLLPGYEQFGANFTHGISASIARAELEIAIEQGANIVYPTTGTAQKIIELAKNAGYNVKMIYCDLPAEQCISRAMSRFLETRRFVDPYYILNNGNTVEKIKNVAENYGIMLIIEK